jgi:putative mRNA 3-end processing factor
MALLEFTDRGIYCERGDFYIDPWLPVKNAVITHAHADHSRTGMKRYLAHSRSIPVMKHRLGNIKARALEYGEKLSMNGVKISLHPAGHIPGSAQVKVQYQGEIWVVTGDYKLGDDGISEPFESVKCHCLVTESTFGLPVYKWSSNLRVMEEINAWWAANKDDGVTSVMLGYSLGKAQRILCGLDQNTGPVFLHGAIHHSNRALESAGLKLPEAEYVHPDTPRDRFKGALILAPPSALGSPWMKKFKPFRVAIASGWMSLRGARRRRNVDRGFVLSDHADWNELNRAVIASGADKIFVTHGYTDIFSNWLNERGMDAQPVNTEYEGELSEIGEGTPDETDSQ